MTDGAAAGAWHMPPEWAPHEATWLSWPHNRDTWPHDLPVVEAALARAVEALAPGERVDVNVLDAGHEDHARRLVAAADGEVRFHRRPTNDAWIRDHGAIFVVDGRGARLAVDARFNAWGGKYPPWDLDDAVAAAMAAATGTPLRRTELVMEGGSIEVDGDGLLLTTRSCIPNANRNPGLSVAQIEQRLKSLFGATGVIWIDGALAGDDTDGHVDNLARFVAPGRVLAVTQDDGRDANHAALQAMMEDLKAWRGSDGAALEIVPLPLPEPVRADGRRLPASYANFYVANGVVLLPVFGGRRDDDAGATLEACFPSRRVVPIDCRSVVAGLGALHCLTQQQPLP